MTSLTPSHSEEALQSRLLREQEFENIHIMEFAGLQDGCQHEVLLQRTLSETTIGIAPTCRCRAVPSPNIPQQKSK